MREAAADQTYDSNSCPHGFRLCHLTRLSSSVPEETFTGAPTYQPPFILLISRREFFLSARRHYYLVVLAARVVNIGPAAAFRNREKKCCDWVGSPASFRLSRRRSASLGGEGLDVG